MLGIAVSEWASSQLSGILQTEPQEEAVIGDGTDEEDEEEEDEEED